MDKLDECDFFGDLCFNSTLNPICGVTTTPPNIDS